MTLGPADLEFVTRIADPNDQDPDGGDISVRVMFTGSRLDPLTEGSSGYDISVYGVFRMDSDAEIDFNGLPQSEQDKIEEGCVKHLEDSK